MKGGRKVVQSSGENKFQIMRRERDRDSIIRNEKNTKEKKKMGDAAQELRRG